MAKLYPPQINGTIPAFYYSEGATKIVVPFTMNKAVAVGEVAGFALKIKTVNGDVKGVIINENPVLLVTSNASVTFFPNDIDFIVGQYYKVQLAYIDTDGVIGYYSTVGIIKCTTKPLVEIDGLQFGKSNTHSHSYIGTYSQSGGDVTEKMYSYRFLLYDNELNIIADSGEKLHNTSFDTVPYESHAEFTFNQELNSDSIYFIQFIVTTTNQLTISSLRYKITARRLVPPDIALSLMAGLDFNNGYIVLSMTSDQTPTITGTYLISRASSKNNFQWEELRRIDLHGVSLDTWFYRDYTVEQGITYQYSIQQYNAQGVYSNRMFSNTLTMDFEDMFLFDGKRQLRIRYNPKVSTFKTDLLENKTDTIGSKYPFISRNGNVNYKEFAISGLISYLADENENFIAMSDLGLDGFSDITQVYGKYGTTNLVDYNIAAERIFKNEVLDWLNDGRVKLFKSPTEGNFLVRLMNISLSPMDQLSRMLHTFSATAYEMADLNIENLYYYNIVDSTENLEVQTRWMTIDIRSAVEAHLLRTGKTLEEAIGDQILLNKQSAMSVSFVDMIPGTLVSLDSEVIQFGASGAYSYQVDDYEHAFSEILYTINNTNNGLLTYSYLIQAVTMFGTIHDIQIVPVPIEQFIGTSYLNKARVWDSENHYYVSSLNLLDAVSDTRLKLLKTFFIRAESRPIETLYIPDNFNSNEIKAAFLDGSLEDYMSYDYYTDMYCTGEPFDWDTANPLVLYRIRFEAHTTPYNHIKNYKYYVDANLDDFSELTNICIDGSNHQIVTYSHDIFNMIINDEVINVAEIEKYYLPISNFKLDYIEIKEGVIFEISSVKQITTFNVELLGSEYPELYAARTQYQTALMNMSVIRQNGEDYDTTGLNQAYNAYLLALNNTLDIYREENGLVI